MQSRAPLILALCLSLAPAGAAAGAWLRAEGTGFASWTVKVQDDESATAYSTLFAEYGLNPDLTVGLDLGSDEEGEHKALAFVRVPLSREGLHVAFELGAGALDEGAALRPGISVGKGLDLAGLGGWWNLDTRAELTQGGTELAIDATLGVAPWEGTKLITQLQQGGPLADPDFIRLEGAAVWQVAPGRLLEVGLTTALKDSEDFGVKFGIWHEF
ncbi:hypothetical protein [Roseovarius aquimarinus]|uniref:Porin n=1 Tax=Roseovarius aquimarinus TaxID=1229156 RepID=A0ABW7I3F3_9RHOB